MAVHGGDHRGLAQGRPRWPARAWLCRAAPVADENSSRDMELILEAVLPEVAARIPCEGKRKTTRAREAITGFIGRGVYEFREDWLWRP